ncbi:MAG: hypothetical protein P9M00_00610 [Candidatus Tritonobacter lacicola]|nr:hypothetical protein [Candidatus Tritonobacter lacicola]
MRSIVIPGLVLFLAMAPCLGQVPTPSPSSSSDASFLVKKLASGQELSREDLRKLDSTAISVESRAVSTAGPGDVEIFSGEKGPEKRIYLLKMESRDEQTKELLELQRNLLRNQLMVLRVLGVIGKHQEVMGQRLSRTENSNRELMTGMQDTSRGVDMARTDIASTLVETTDISEMTEELTLAVEEIQKQLEDIETGIDGLQDTSDQILSTVENIE